jgi:hypothetical protein
MLAGVLLSGCMTHQVAFNDPAPATYDSKLGLGVGFYMSNELRVQEYRFRSGSSGLGNTWLVPYGKVAHQYALAYLPGAFQSFEEVDDPERPPTGGILIRLDAMAYEMKGQAAHCSMTFSVLSLQGRKVMEKTYTKDGPSELGRVAGGGVFGQKSAIRQSSHVVLESIFKNLVKDIRNHF